MNNTPQNIKIIIAHTRQSYLSVQKLAKEQPVDKWLFLGRSYLQLKCWEKHLSDYYRIPTGKLLNDIAWESKNSYVEWSASFSDIYKDDISWWTSRIWERNTMVSPLFLYFCYLKLLGRIFFSNANGNQTLLIICESDELGKAVFAYVKKEGYYVILAPGYTLQMWNEKVHFIGAIILAWARWIRDSWLKWRSAKQTKKYEKTPLKSISDRPRVVIHTCIDETCLGKDGRFHDRYFTILPDWLRKKGYDVQTIPWLYNVSTPLKKAYRWFRENKDSFIIIEDFVRLEDYFWAAFQIIMQISKPRGKQSIDGIEITELVKAERWKQLKCADTAKFFLYPRLLGKWKKRDIRFDIFIDTFENMVKEKPALFFIKRFFPEVTTIGYQNAQLLTLLPSYQTTLHEHQVGPYPDVIISNGSWARDILVNNGFDKLRVIAGPSLRYQHLFKLKENHLKSMGATKAILIICPLSLDGAVELLQKSIDVLNEIQDLYSKVWVKFHPMINPLHLLEACKIEKLPRKWESVSGGMQEWLEKANYVIGMDTSAILEAIVMGIPTVIVGRESGLTMNPLGWLKDSNLPQPVFGVDEFKKRMGDCLLLSDKEKKALKDTGKKLLHKCFIKPDNENMNAFADVKK